MENKDKNGNWVVVPEDLKLKAKELYMGNHSIMSIARDLELKRTTVQMWVKKGWAEERKIAHIEKVQDFLNAKKSEFLDITSGALQALKSYVISTMKTIPTEKEARTLVSIIDTLDKHTRLDENKPTEITQNEKPYYVAEIIEKLRKDDPFFKETIEEIDYDDNK